MGIVEDEDIEQIIADMMLMYRYLAMKMYDYGEKFGTMEWDKKIL